MSQASKRIVVIYPNNMTELNAAPIVIDYETFRRDASRARQVAIDDAARAVVAPVLRVIASVGAWMNRRAERSLRSLSPGQHCYAK